MIDHCGGIQWPWPEAKEGQEIPAVPPVERRLFEDNRFYTPDGKAKFLFSPPTAVAEPTDDEYPFVLLTGRGTSAQWHTGSRTNKSDVLRRLAPEGCYVEINPDDANRLRISAGDLISVRSRRGIVTATAFVTATVQKGNLFIPMHYPEMNQLTFPSFDPHSRQPSYKHCAVAVSRT